MSDENRNQDDIEPTSGGSDDSTGGGADGGAGGTGTADSSAALRDAEARARSFQSEADKARKRAAELEAQLRAKGESGGETPTPAVGMTPEQIQEQVRQAMRQETARARELDRAAETARSEYPNADPSLLDASRYESAEEMLEAVKGSHDAISAHVQARIEAEEAELRKRYAERYGDLPAPPANDDGGTPTGDPTLAQLNAMSIRQLEELEAANPGVIARVQRSADQLTT